MIACQHSYIPSLLFCTYCGERIKQRKHRITKKKAAHTASADLWGRGDLLGISVYGDLLLLNRSTFDVLYLDEVSEIRKQFALSGQDQGPILEVELSHGMIFYRTSKNLYYVSVTQLQSRDNHRVGELLSEVHPLQGVSPPINSMNPSAGTMFGNEEVLCLLTPTGTGMKLSINELIFDEHMPWRVSRLNVICEATYSEADLLIEKRDYNEFLTCTLTASSKLYFVILNAERTLESRELIPPSLSGLPSQVMPETLSFNQGSIIYKARTSRGTKYFIHYLSDLANGRELHSAIGEPEKLYMFTRVDTENECIASVKNRFHRVDLSVGNISPNPIRAQAIHIPADSIYSILHTRGNHLVMTSLLDGDEYTVADLSQVKEQVGMHTITSIFGSWVIYESSHKHLLQLIRLI